MSPYSNALNLRCCALRLVWCSRLLTARLALLLAPVLSLLAQAPPPGPAPQDPLMNLMVSQPKLQVPSETRAVAVLDPSIVRTQEVAYLRVVLNALEESIEWPAYLEAPSQLTIEPGAHAQIMQMSGTNLEPRSAMNYRVRASEVGKFQLPEFEVKVGAKRVKVSATKLEVVPSVPASAPAAVQLILELPTTNLYVGQPILVRVRLPNAPPGVAQGLIQPQVIGPGLLTDLASARQRIETAQRGSLSFPIFSYEATLTPLTAGHVPIFAQGFTASRYFGGAATSPGNAVAPGAPLQYVLAESEPVELSVRPLPREGQLPGFTGAIGPLAVGPPVLATNVLRVGDPVQLSVCVTNQGGGSLARLVPPPVPQVNGWQVLTGGNSSPAPTVTPVQTIVLPPFGPMPAGNRPEGVVTFRYTLIPLFETAESTPAIPYSCFDPVAGKYVDLTIPSVPVTVQASPWAADYEALAQANTTGGGQEKPLELSSLAASPGRAVSSLVPPQQRAWFPFVQAAPALLFLGLWSWDRRRRYLEQHPDVVLRRRARRALQKQWRALRRAARAADAPRFATTAINALRVACAPHYPAEPRALVGADVLPLLPENERAGKAGEVVRRFFAVTDASRFDTTPAGAEQLLGLQPELERVLEQLEQRL